MHPSRVLLTVFSFGAMLMASGTGAPQRLGLPAGPDVPRAAEAVTSSGGLTWQASPTWSGSFDGPVDGNLNPWWAPGFDDSAWQVIQLPDVDSTPTNQDRFYRATFDSPEPASFPAIYFASDDGLWLYLNGVSLGHWGGGWRSGGCVNNPRGWCSLSTPVPPISITSYLAPGPNVVAVRVSNAGCCHSYFDLSPTTGPNAAFGSAAENPYGSFSDEPVNLATGNLTHQHVDLAIPGRGPSLIFRRSYNSQDGFAGALGPGWLFNYDMRLVIEMQSGAISAVTAVNEEGRRDRYVRNPDGSFSRPLQTQVPLTQNPDGSFQLTTKDQIRYNFDASGVLTSIADRNNNTTTLTYASGLLTAVTDPGGRSLTFTYGDPNHPENITQVADPLGRTVGFQYDGNGDLTTVIDVKGGVTTYAYSNHRMTSLTDANGHVASQNIYDTANRVVEQTDAIGGKTCLYYGSGPTYTSAACPGVTPAPTATQTVVVDPRSHKSTYNFDASFRTTQVTDALSGVTGYAYDSNNNRTCVTDPLGHKTGSSYDTKGNVTGVIDADNTDANCALKTGGVKWSFAYTASNDVDLATDPLGHQTDYVYDGAGNLTQVIRKDGGAATKSLTCFTRDAAGLMTELIESTTLSDCTGNKTKFEYDSYGNQTAVVDPRFSGQPTPPKTTFTFDLGGRMLTSTNELGHGTTYTYDAQNNALTMKDNLNDTTTYTYDAKGSLKTVTDANSKLTTYNYDNADRLTSVVDALSQTTAYGYDANGNRTSVTNARSKATTYVYDALNRLQAVTDPLSRVTSYQYDAAGNLSQRTDARGLVTKYLYDAANRLTRLEHWNGANLVDAVDYTYDAAGNRLSMVDPTGNTAYAYDALNRPTSVTFPGPSTVAYQYDNTGNRSRITYPDSKYVDYTYDEAHNMATVTDWLTNQTAYTYDNAGHLTKSQLPNGAWTDYTYDTADRLTGVANKKAGSTFSSFAYSLDPVGNRTQVSDNTGVTSYAYDDLYRLTGVTYPGPRTAAYTYDAAGNRLSMNGNTYTYDDADQLQSWVIADTDGDGCTDAEELGTNKAKGGLRDPLNPRDFYDITNNTFVIGAKDKAVSAFDLSMVLSFTPAKYTLDTNGNTIPDGQEVDLASGLGPGTGPDGAVSGPDLSQVVTEGNHTCVLAPNVGDTESYQYDANGNQTLRQAQGAAADTFTYDHENRLTQSVVGGVTSTYAYNGDGLRVSRTSGGTTTNYVWDVTAGLPVVLQDGTNTHVYGLDLLSATDNSGVQSYFLYDGLGSTVGLTNSSGNQTTKYTYDAFGSPRNRATWSGGNYWQFTGEQRDSDSGFYYLRARYYDPAIGRFLGQDPMPDINLYTYVSNNPLVYVDPTGLYGLTNLLNRYTLGTTTRIIRAEWQVQVATLGSGEPGHTVTFGLWARVTSSGSGSNTYLQVSKEGSGVFAYEASVSYQFGRYPPMPLEPCTDGLCPPSPSASATVRAGAGFGEPTEIELSLSRSVNAEIGTYISSTRLTLDLLTGKTSQNTCNPWTSAYLNTPVCW